MNFFSLESKSYHDSVARAIAESENKKDRYYFIGNKNVGKFPGSTNYKIFIPVPYRLMEITTKAVLTNEEKQFRGSRNVGILFTSLFSADRRQKDNITTTPKISC